MASSYALPSTMRVAYISEYDKPYSFEQRALPTIRDDEMLVKVMAAGFCHSDLQVLQGQFGSPIGMIPSHEPAGIVVQVGAACGNEFALGDRVGVLNYKRACGHCHGCGLARRTAHANANASSNADSGPGKTEAQYRNYRPDPRFCENRETAGFQHDGAFAEYLVADPHTTVRLPDNLSMEQAAPLMCAGATVWGSLERVTAGLVPGDIIAIIGIGGLGHLGVQFAKSLGFRVVAVDNRAAGRQLAHEVPTEDLKADWVVDSGDLERTAKDIFDMTRGEGLAAAVVCTDSLAVNAWALRMLRIRGKLGVLGLPASPWHFDADCLVFRELTICGSYVASRDSCERMLQCVERAGIRSHVTTVAWKDVASIVAKYEEADFRGRLVVRINDV